MNRSASTPLELNSDTYWLKSSTGALACASGLNPEIHWKYPLNGLWAHNITETPPLNWRRWIKWNHPPLRIKLSRRTLWWRTRCVFSSAHFLDLFKRKEYPTKCGNSGALLSLTITRRIQMIFFYLCRGRQSCRTARRWVYMKNRRKNQFITV